jgi:hypothetical protein
VLNAKRGGELVFGTTPVNRASFTKSYMRLVSIAGEQL